MRCSSLPQLFGCPSSQLPTDHPYDPPSDAAELGTAVHEAIAVSVHGGEPCFEGIAERYGVKSEDVVMLHTYGMQAWQTLADYFPTPHTEWALSADRLTGHADVFHRDEHTMAILDWKTSRQRSNVRPQLRGYGTCAVETYGMPTSGKVSLFTVWLRLGEYDVHTMTEQDVFAFREELGRKRSQIGKEYAPGEPCMFCPRQLVCESRTEYVRSAACALTVIDSGAKLEPETLVALYPRAQMLERAIKHYRDAVRMTLHERGPVQDPAGNTYELAEQRRAEVCARQAWPVLQEEGFTDDDLAGCVSMSIGSVETVVGKRAPRGKMGAAKKALRALLAERGAMTHKVTPTIRVTKGAGA